MNTFIKIGTAICLWIFFTACNSDEDESTQFRPLDYQSLKLQASAQDAESPIVPEEGFSIDLTGQSQSCNLTDEASYAITAIISNLDEAGNFDLENGEFHLYAQRTGCELSGSLTGQGRIQKREIFINAIVDVSCGNGAFKSNGGALSLKLSGEYEGDNFEIMNYSLDLQGTIDMIKTFHKLNIHANVEDAEAPLEIFEGYSIDFSGLSRSCNMTDKANYSLSAAISDVDAEGNFNLRNGEFHLCSVPTGCELSGGFSGQGYVTEEDFSIHAVIKVICGNGTFDTNRGVLNLRISGEFTGPENDRRMNYSLDVTGNI